MTNALLLKDIAVQVRTVSAGGCLIESTAHLPVGTIGVLTVVIDGEPRAEWFRVNRVEPTDRRGGTQLVAAEFLPLVAGGQHSIRSAVRRMWSGHAARRTTRSAGTLSGWIRNFAARLRTVDDSVKAANAGLPRQSAHSGDAAAEGPDGSQVAESRHAHGARGSDDEEGEDPMKGLIARLHRDDEGQDLIEYGLLLGLITIAVIGTVALIRGDLTAIYLAVQAAVGTAVP